MAFEITGNGVNFKLITFCPLFLLCLLHLWFICLYFSFSYSLALGYFLEWFRWGSCQPLLMTTCECLRRWERVWWERGREGFFSEEGGVSSRTVEDQIAPTPGYVSHPPHLVWISWIHEGDPKSADDHEMTNIKFLHSGLPCWHSG